MWERKSIKTKEIGQNQIVKLKYINFAQNCNLKIIYRIRVFKHCLNNSISNYFQITNTNKINVV